MTKKGNTKDSFVTGEMFDKRKKTKRKAEDNFVVGETKKGKTEDCFVAGEVSDKNKNNFMANASWKVQVTVAQEQFLRNHKKKTKKVKIDDSFVAGEVSDKVILTNWSVGTQRAAIAFGVPL
ncbi:hypothetical protein TSUD_102870 [Trifolium subterraneum]|uniref:Uncharacterized protein n=1 Tax=Trifolium subterraneum TaxID=3900 RepID=A0A2Z6NML4_TRISU|nr:hypothetical protein TSUD_102870 [Trifolium subterraneum]